ncbi:MAG: EVE domain-containing protein [Acidobacteriota bacterium]
MAYWILKTEPTVYSYADLERDGRTVWDGVTNNKALKNIRSMRRGDLAMVYHTGEEKQVVGIAEIDSDPYDDPKRKGANLVVVELQPRQKVQRPVTLAAVKADPSLKQFELVRLPRLSVVPVDAPTWKKLLAMAK